MAATLEPPAAPPPAAEPKAPKPPRDDRHLMEKLSRSGYFLGAVLLHLLIFLIVATWVVFKAPTPPPDDFVKTYVPSGAPPPPPPPPPDQTMPVSTHTTPTPRAIVSDSAVPSFSIPLPDLTQNTPLDNTLNKIAPKIMTVTNNLNKRLPAIKAFIMEGAHRTLENIQDSEGDPHRVEATFPVFLASYADGDWGCNVVMQDGKVVAGSLPDLVAKMNEWSHNKLKGTVVPTPLVIGSSDLVDKKPPFIFFTGHKDFVLTDDEITNLRNYLQVGGAIWGDSALPGYGSRFDVAFHREMKRVIPDKDKNFEDVPLTHDLFVKDGWFNITKLPDGMNYYHEPMQHLDLDGKVAILYTPNDYSDLFDMRILPGDAAFEGGWRPGLKLWTNEAFLENSLLFFRNFNLPACLAAHQLGMNIIGFLLVRFDQDMLLIP